MLLAGAGIGVAGLVWALGPLAGPRSTTGPTPTPATGALPPAFVHPDRHPGGIPRTLDRAPVLVGLDARLLASRAGDASHFLFGGWFDSRILQACSGGIGPVDPNPLGTRGCPRHLVEGAPGSLHFPDGLTMPEGDGPIVLEVHTRDPSAATCLPENRMRCFEKVVVDAVRWFGDETTAVVPIGPNEAQGLVFRLGIAQGRVQPDGTTYHVSADLFTIPIACREPWPSYVFRVHGDPRHGLIAVFPDVDRRTAFESAVAAEDALECLRTPFPRPGPPRWLSMENVSVLTFGDDGFVAALRAAMAAGPNEQVRSVGLAFAPPDQTEQTLFDYLSARSAGLDSNALGERSTDRDPEGWTLDTLRRHAAGALAGEIQRLDVPVDGSRLGPEAAALLTEIRAVQLSLFRVTYRGATNPDLLVEEYVVFRIPDSTFKDWMAIRVAGAPYPPPP